MKKTDVSRRRFLGKSGAAALALPLAAAIPAAIDATSPKSVQAAVEQDTRQWIPNRTLPTRAIGPATVTVSGLPRDGVSDASAAIQSAIDSLGADGGTVTIPWHGTGGKNMCVYMLDTQAQTDPGGKYCAISMKSNVRLQSKPGVKLQAMTANAGSINTDRAYMISCAGVHDIEIANCWLVGERYTHVYSGIGTGTDEHFYGISLTGGTGINIRATQISDFTGDGICMGGTPTDVVMSDVLSTANRRQALSITSGNSIYIYDSEFSYTSGTAPMDGIDIEPQGGAHVNGVTIENCVIKGNAGCGIQLNAQGTNISNMNVKNCLISYNYWIGFVAQMGRGGTIETGSLYGNAFSQNGSYGLALTGNTASYTVGSAHSDNSDGHPPAGATSQSPQNRHLSNSFADNNNDYTSINYPNQSKTTAQGYVAGDDMKVSAGSLSSGTTIQWNTYYTRGPVPETN